MIQLGGDAILVAHGITQIADTSGKVEWDALSSMMSASRGSESMPASALAERLLARLRADLNSNPGTVLPEGARRFNVNLELIALDKELNPSHYSFGFLRTPSNDPFSNLVEVKWPSGEVISHVFGSGDKFHAAIKSGRIPELDAVRRMPFIRSFVLEGQRTPITEREAAGYARQYIEVASRFGRYLPEPIDIGPTSSCLTLNDPKVVQ